MSATTGKQSSTAENQSGDTFERPLTEDNSAWESLVRVGNQFRLERYLRGRLVKARIVSDAEAATWFLEHQVPEPIATAIKNRFLSPSNPVPTICLDSDMAAVLSAAERADFDPHALANRVLRRGYKAVFRSHARKLSNAIDRFEKAKATT